MKQNSSPRDSHHQPAHTLVLRITPRVEGKEKQQCSFHRTAIGKKEGLEGLNPAFQHCSWQIWAGLFKCKSLSLITKHNRKKSSGFPTRSQDGMPLFHPFLIGISPAEIIRGSLCSKAETNLPLLKSSSVVLHEITVGWYHSLFCIV